MFCIIWMQIMGKSLQFKYKLHSELTELTDHHRRIRHHFSQKNFNNSNHTISNWPIKREAIIEGDIVLGGLMMVHEREESHICGPIMPQGGVQALEAMLYTLDQINRNRKFFNNVTIGAHVLDDCDRDTYGLEIAVDFIKGTRIPQICKKCAQKNVDL